MPPTKRGCGGVDKSAGRGVSDQKKKVRFFASSTLWPIVILRAAMRKETTRSCAAFAISIARGLPCVPSPMNPTRIGFTVSPGARAFVSGWQPRGPSRGSRPRPVLLSSDYSTARRWGLPETALCAALSVRLWHQRDTSIFPVPTHFDGIGDVLKKRRRAARRRAPILVGFKRIVAIRAPLSAVERSREVARSLLGRHRLLQSRQPLLECAPLSRKLLLHRRHLR